MSGLAALRWPALLAVLSIAGCLRPTSPGSLAHRQIHSLELRLASAKALCPGFGDDLVISASSAEGERHLSSGAGGGEIGWANYDLEMTGGRVSTTTGRIRIVADPLATSGRPPVVKVTSVHYPSATARLVVPIRYDCEFVAHFAGRQGTPGRPGRAGKPASASTPAGHGGPAATGRRGGRGLDVEVTLSVLELDDGSKVLRAVLRAKSARRRGTFFLDPERGSLRVLVSGGRGGRGGLGGPGGAAKGAGGNGGAGGLGGSGGDGGTVRMTVDPAAKPFQSRVTFDLSGGKGGPGGPAGNGGRGTPAGQDGALGQAGEPGKAGPEPEIVYAEVFEM